VEGALCKGDQAQRTLVDCLGLHAALFLNFGRNSVVNVQSSDGVTFGAYFTPIEFDWRQIIAMQ
jgi:hypothetical protein